MAIDIKKLRQQASTDKKILILKFYPDIDSVPNVDALTDFDDLVEIQFESVHKP